jgi:hypothetical protein
MKTVPVTATKRGRKGAALCGLDGKPITRMLSIPENKADVIKLFGSVKKAIMLAVDRKQWKLQTEIRKEYDELHPSPAKPKKTTRPNRADRYASADFD